MTWVKNKWASLHQSKPSYHFFHFEPLMAPRTAARNLWVPEYGTGLHEAKVLWVLCQLVGEMPGQSKCPTGGGGEGRSLQCSLRVEMPQGGHQWWLYATGNPETRVIGGVLEYSRFTYIYIWIYIGSIIYYRAFTYIYIASRYSACRCMLFTKDTRHPWQQVIVLHAALASCWTQVVYLVPGSLRKTMPHQSGAHMGQPNR